MPMTPDGELTTMRDRLNEAIRMVDADPQLADPNSYQDARTENLLTSIAHSLVILAAGPTGVLGGSVEANRPQPAPEMILNEFANYLDLSSWPVHPAATGRYDGELFFDVTDGASAGTYRLTVARLP